MGNDEIQFYFQFDPEQKIITLMVCSTETIDCEEYRECLESFLHEHKGPKMKELFDNKTEFAQTVN